MTLTIDELVLRYLQHARSHYRKNGKETSEVSSIMPVLPVPVRASGRDRARDFGPLKLQAVRDDMVALGWTRKSINAQIGRIRRMFAWAVSQRGVDWQMKIDDARCKLTNLYPQILN